MQKARSAAAGAVGRRERGVQTDPPREREGHRTRVPTPTAMRAREVSRPGEAELTAAEAKADDLIRARLAGRSRRAQDRGAEVVPDRS